MYSYKCVRAILLYRAIVLIVVKLLYYCRAIAVADVAIVVAIAFFLLLLFPYFYS